MKTNLRDDALHPDHRKDASGGRALRTATPRAGTRLTRGNEAWSDNGVVTAMPCQGPNSPSRQAFRIWCQSIQRLGKRDDWILRQRVITPTTHRTGSTHSASRRRHQVSFSYMCICWLARLYLQYLEYLFACLCLARRRRRRRRSSRALHSLKSLHLRRAKPGLPAPALACCTRALFLAHLRPRFH